MVTFTKEQLVTIATKNRKVTSTSLQVSLRKRRPWKDNLIELNICFKQKWLVLAHIVQILLLCVDLFLCLFPLRKSFWVAARLFKAVLLPACSTDQFLFVCVCFLACVFLGVYVFVWILERGLLTGASCWRLLWYSGGLKRFIWVPVFFCVSFGLFVCCLVQDCFLVAGGVHCQLLRTASVVGACTDQSGGKPPTSSSGGPKNYISLIMRMVRERNRISKAISCWLISS